MLKEFEEFSVVNDSEHVLILIDEAHRSHNKELGFNIFSAFPNASKIAFTGTPLISKRHKKPTHEIFGTYIDTYKIRDAVNDEATVALKYEGKAVYTKVDSEKDLEHEFLDLFGHRTQKNWISFVKSMERLETSWKQRNGLSGLQRTLWTII